METVNNYWKCEHLSKRQTLTMYMNNLSNANNCENMIFFIKGKHLKKSRKINLEKKKENNQRWYMFGVCVFTDGLYSRFLRVDGLRSNIDTIHMRRPEICGDSKYHWHDITMFFSFSEDDRSSTVLGSWWPIQ